MTTVNDVLRNKPHGLWSVHPEDMVYDALALMADKNIGAVLVLQDNQLVGLLSERDYARKLILENRSSRETPVSAVMTRHVAYVSPDKEIEDCMALMSERRFRHLPVMAGDELVGLVSIGDLVQAVIADHKFMIEQLEQYIIGG
jgi:CBS domain-containing protein